MSFYVLNKLSLLKAVAVYYKLTVRTIKTTGILNSICTLTHSPNAKLSKTIIDKFLCLPIPECMCLVEYVWIDGTGQNLRSKARTLNFIPNRYKEVPVWSYDGSATYQASGKNTDVQLVPVALYRCPFRRGNNKIVLCETYSYDCAPIPSNSRAKCRDTINKVCEHEIMWGIEQEYLLLDADGRPFGWPVMLGEPKNYAGYYCGVGSDRSYGRDIIEAHYRACLFAGVQISGSNSDMALSQWEYQVGVCKGIKGADDLWMARYIISRIAEEYGLDVSLEHSWSPNWSGSTCHINFSTKAMRDDNGLTAIQDAITKLKDKHAENLPLYGFNISTEKTCQTGKHRIDKLPEFTQGIGDRSASVRISNPVAAKKKGHFEDRRPLANADPYIMCENIIRTCLL